MRTEKPKSFKFKAMLAVAGGLMVVGAAAPAFAVSAGGGDWNYGVGAGVNYSNYYHGSLVHGSSVENGNGLSRSNCIASGNWSYANQPATLWSNKAYWRHC